jgi:hypothetical protein
MKFIILLLALAMFLNGGKNFIKMIFSLPTVDYSKFEKTIKDMYNKDKDEHLVFTVLNIISLAVIIGYIIIYFITMVYVGNIFFVLAGMYLVIRAFVGYNEVCAYIRAVLQNESTYKFKKRTFSTYFNSLVALGYNGYLLYYVIIHWK